MKTAEIKQRWLDFFASKDHVVVPSASLISEDPSLLFTVAGMVPFIPYMTGLVPAPFGRATSVQKCIRTLDIDEVGKTTRHGTFFQMNGNFSFGDYFKKEAIQYAWEFLTKPLTEGGLEIPKEKLWVTVYQDDDEAIEYWTTLTDVPSERIQRMGMKDNYWSTGQPGPAGPCSEIFYDRGPAFGVDGGPAADDSRYLEIWNLVFMQYERGAGTGKESFEILGELPKKNIDTGMGLERVAFLLQGVENIYEIDQVKPVLDKAADLAGKTYGANKEDDVRLRVVADHVRSSLMLICDGVSPGNDGRGYVLRRLLRRTVRAMRLLGVSEPCFNSLFASSKNAMVDAYPELEAEYPRIQKTVLAEEEAFLRTLVAGTTVLEAAIAKAKSESKDSLSGETSFLLHDTYGFPIDLTVEIAEENGLTVDRDDFIRLMDEQKNRAKADARAKKSGNTDLSIYSEFRAKGASLFTGYEELQSEATILGIIVDGQPVGSISEGLIGEVVLDRTSFYAESGGQTADAGVMLADKAELEVLDVQKPVKGLISHKVLVKSGSFQIGQKVLTTVDSDWRLGAAQAHSATHVVHAALRQVLGPTALQSGSLNKPGYMRLDFSWNQALSAETKSEIEEVSNLAIRQDLAVSAQYMSLPEAKNWGAVALFGETYDESVRVVQIGGPWSRELCGGTHVARSSQIGLVSITNESSVGSGSRRIEANVGLEAISSFNRDRLLLHKIAEQLKVSPLNASEKLENFLLELKEAQKAMQAQESSALLSQIPEILSSVETIGQTKAIFKNLVVRSPESLREVLQLLRDKTKNEDFVIILAAVIDDKPVLMASVSNLAQSRGVKAGELVRIGSAILGGGGGGKADLAQGGGVDAGKLEDALAEIRKSLS
ncbi:MAG: alanine--tRNA ligase [Micrococcales bacterium]|nr:alanine--tRNA ligase [Micrococcales bacterium]